MTKAKCAGCWMHPTCHQPLSLLPNVFVVLSRLLLFFNATPSLLRKLHPPFPFLRHSLSWEEYNGEGEGGRVADVDCGTKR